MSRPLTEQGVALTQGRQGFSINQLQRRPAVNALGDFGSQTQEVFLPEFADSTNSDVSAGVGWLGDAASYGGGYVTKDSPADGSYFSFMSYFAPQGSIWSLRYLNFVGPDYGILKVSIASLGYQLEERPSGCQTGKIQDYLAGYGPALSYIATTSSLDCYNAAPAQPVSGLADYQLVVGGDLGDPLTTFSDGGDPCADGAGNDPYSGFGIMDGGPGWYRTKMFVEGKNASSSSYRFRVTRVAWSRVDDLGAV